MTKQTKTKTKGNCSKSWDMDCILSPTSEEEMIIVTLHCSVIKKFPKEIKIFPQEQM